MSRSYCILFLLCVLTGQLAVSADLPTKDAADNARKHMGMMSGFLLSLNEPLLFRDCGGATEVYRLSIIRTLRESEVIRIAKYAGMEPFLTHTTGKLRDLKTSISNIDEQVFESLKRTVDSTPFIDMESSPGMWGVDADRYNLEWCRGTDYYGVDREQDDENLAPVFDFLRNLVTTE